MLSTTLPLVPFAPQPRKEWKPGAEKKPRLNLKDFDKRFQKSYIDDDDSYSSASYSSMSSDGSEEKPVGRARRRAKSVSDPAIENDRAAIEKARQAAKDKARNEFFDEPAAKKKAEEDKFFDNIEFLLANPQLLSSSQQYLLDEFKPKKRRPLFPADFRKRFIFNPVTRFLQWRRDERERRVHYIYREYEKKIKEYDLMLKEKAKKEIEDAEKEVLIEAYKAGERVKKSLFKRRNKLAVTKKLADDVIRRNKEETRMKFNCEHLPKWAIERYHEKQEEQMMKIASDKIDAEEKRKRDLAKAIADMDAADLALYEEDVAITREVTSIMRRSGIIEGVNAAEKVLPPIVPSPTKMVLSLKKDVDFSNFGNKRTKHEYFHPFDKDISEFASTLRVLKARGLGERGALCLSADFVRTPLPQIEVLDLSFCEMKTRGVGRVLRGIKLAKFVGLEELNLRGNHLTDRSLAYIRDLFESDSFLNLRVLDLGDNELGDECADSIIRMIFAGCFKNLVELRLQNNGIKDLGFSKLIKVLQSVYHTDCPNLERFCLERNHLISAEIKQEFSPLPPIVSV